MGALENITTTKGLHSASVKCLVYGKSGVGKTALLGTGSNERTLILSAESGLLSLADKSIDVLAVTNWKHMIGAFMQLRLGNHKYSTICIDSLTEASDMLVKELEADAYYGDAKNALKMWGEYNKRIISFIKSFRDLPDVNIIFTALAEDVNDGGLLIKKPLIAGNKAQSLLASFFDEVMHLSINESTGERELHTQPSSFFDAKDRSGKLLPIEQPDLTVIFDKIKG